MPVSFNHTVQDITEPRFKLDLTDLSLDAQVSAAAKYDFVIFEDRKFADIGNTVVHQCASGHYTISSWATIINAHPLPGPGIVQGLQQAMKEGSGLLLIAEMSRYRCATPPSPTPSFCTRTNLEYLDICWPPNSACRSPYCCSFDHGPLLRTVPATSLPRDTLRRA